MYRRRFLALAGAAATTAGCTGGPASNPTESATPSDESTPAGRVSVADATVQPGVVALTTPDSIGIYADAGQYFLARVDVVGGDGPSTAEFGFHFGGDTAPPREYSSGLWRDGEYGVGYEAGEGGGWLVFELPETGEASGSQLRWPGGEWTPFDRVRDRLATPPPTFDISFEAPDTVARGETPTLSVSVTNTSDVAGTCVLAMNRVGPNVAYTPVRDVVWDVEPGATRTEAWAGEPPTGEREVTYHLDGAGIERRSRTVRLADDGGENSTDGA